METSYTELYKNMKNVKMNNFSRIGCDYCVIPHDYKTAEFKIDNKGKKICNYCEKHVIQEFKGLDQLKKDIDLQDVIRFYKCKLKVRS